MSKAGNFTAYQQYKPKDNGTIQAIQHWSNFYEQKQQNDKLQKQRDNELQFKIDKEKADQIDKWSESPKIDLTGVANLDQFKAKSMNFFMQQRQPLVEKLASTKQGSPEYIDAVMKLKRIDQFPAQLNTITNNEIEDAKKYSKGKGKDYVRTEEGEAMFSNTLNPDIRYNPETADFAFMMPDSEDPTKKVPVTSQEYLNGQKPVKLMPRYDDEKWTNENIKLLKQKIPVKTVYDENSNSYIKTTGYDKETEIIPFVRTSLFENGEPTEIGFSFASELGYKPKDMLDPAIQEKIITHYTDRLSPALAMGEDVKWDDKRAMYTLKNKQLAQKTQNDAAKLNLATAKAQGEGKVQAPPSSTSFVKIPKANAQGQVGFSVNENNLIVTSGYGDSQVSETVKSIYIDPKDKNRVIVNTVKTGKKLDGRKVVPYEEQMTYDSKTDPDNASRFTSDIGVPIDKMHASLSKKAGIKPNAKPKETLQERKKRLGLK